MSEFKYACPVCGQHIKCDSSQAGTVMDCPTCFQKITVPQAPANLDQKFIITGSKVTEKAISVPTEAAPAEVPVKKFPGALVVGLSLLFMGAAAGAIYWATIIHPRHATARSANAAKVSPANTPPAKPKPPEKPAVVAPPANDTNWMLALGTDAISDSPAAGRIHGLDFIAEHAGFQNGSLTLRGGAHGSEAATVINFGGAQPEALAGQNITVTTNADQAARVTLRWKDGGGVMQKTNYTDSYAMRLEFGALANNRLPGKIYLCLPDPEKSYVIGSFKADVHRPKPKPANSQ